jgi:malic enzyme
MTNRANTVAVISDGSEVLGLGNIGPEAAMPVMEGKAALFKRLADIDAIPICLATQDTLMKDLMSKQGAQGTLAYLEPQDQQRRLQGVLMPVESVVELEDQLLLKFRGAHSPSTI